MIIVFAGIMLISSVWVILYVNYFTNQSKRQRAQMRLKEDFKKSAQIIVHQEEAGKGILEDE